VSNKPIGFIINTSMDADHTGGNQSLAKGGFFMLDSANQTRPQAAVVAHLNVLNRMTAPEDNAAAIPTGFWPTDTYDSPDWKLYANDEPLILEHAAAAHSDGDSTVFFRRSDVISTGDIFDMTRYPVIDEKHGGSLVGILKALNHILKDITVAKENEEGGTYIIPGHGACVRPQRSSQLPRHADHCSRAHQGPGEEGQDSSERVRGRQAHLRLRRRIRRRGRPVNQHVHSRRCIAKLR
jgi:glyoxylase-like metal-dependent hydrolase (beta-lactamase superfamily II)